MKKIDFIIQKLVGLLMCLLALYVLIDRSVMTVLLVIPFGLLLMFTKTSFIDIIFNKEDRD